MKNYEQLKGMEKQVSECIINAYNKGYKDGYNSVEPTESYLEKLDRLEKLVEKIKVEPEITCCKCRYFDVRGVRCNKLHIYIPITDYHTFYCSGAESEG